ncbi:DUF4111 domain-containing protein [Lactobacillus sp. UCMA15818]|nr:DUF4111 domain-containing protein [Lactobacillus sp. UCMA15818]
MNYLGGESVDTTEELLTLLKHGYKKILKNNLVGIYIHGSFVLGSYNEAISDLDYLVVVYNPLTLVVKKKLIEYTVGKLWPLAPTKGLEFHIILLRNTLIFNEPVPFELHFSKQHYWKYINNPIKYIYEMHGSDLDLTAHLMITTKFGQVLVGKPIEQVFCLIPKSSYWNSILYDILDAKSTITEQPMYTVLNLCRALAYKKANIITSKLSGGQWGLKNIPAKYSELIKNTLDEYISTLTNKYRRSYNDLVLIEFAEYILNKIKE